MFGSRRFRGATLVGVALGLCLIGSTAIGDDDPPPSDPAPRPSSSRKPARPPRVRSKTEDGLPVCPWHGAQAIATGKAGAARPGRRNQPRQRPRPNPMMPGSFPMGPGIPGMPPGMADMFTRMGEAFARDPATGFQNFVQGLGDLEGPALDGVTLTPQEERQAGKRAREEYLKRAAQQGYPVADDPEKLARVRKLVDRFAIRMKHRDRYPKIEVTLIDAPISDGQSFPGGYLVFTTALVDEPDETTPAGVVAHEMAHLDLGHLYGYARRSKLAEATYARPGATFDQFFTRQMALLGLLMNPYRPEHELEADCEAVTWLYQEGIDGSGLVGFFERLHDRIQDQPPNPFFSFGRSHPYSLERKNHVQRRMAQLRAVQEFPKP